MKKADQPRLLEKTLLALVTADLATGGNGYLLTIGGVRLRVILFLVCVPWALCSSSASRSR